MTGDRDERHTVLVVDDQVDVRFLLRFELEAEGYRVIEATTGQAALDVLEDEDVSLMLLDLSLPDLDGLEVLAALNERGKPPGLRVIVVSAHIDGERERQARDAGATAYLSKPYRAAELWAAIHSVDS